MTRAQLMTSTAVPEPPDAPDPGGWYGAIDAGWHTVGDIVHLRDELPTGTEVRIDYQVHANRDRRRRGRASLGKVSVICPA